MKVENNKSNKMDDQASSYILGIESSCDDSSIAIFDITLNKLIDCITISSSELQNQYGGIVPEIAAREHEKIFIPLITNLFIKHNIIWEKITYISFAEQPGLINCLLVGKLLAQTLAFIFKKPLIPINHVHAHIFSVGLTEKLIFPGIALVISGKTSAFYLVTNFKNITLLEKTSDVAIGEAYDKVARLMSLPYPGGKEIDKIFNNELNLPSLLRNNLNPKKTFSYSGIITATDNLWQKIQNNDSIKNKKEYLSTVFQKFVIDNLIKKIYHWSEDKNIKNIWISGGVAANKYLNNCLKNQKKINVKIVNGAFSSDNAAMIAYYAFLLL